MKRSASDALDGVVDVVDGAHVRGAADSSDAGVAHALEVAAASATDVNALGDAQTKAHEVTVSADGTSAAGIAAAPGPAPAKKRRTTQPIGNLTNAQKRMLCVKFAQVKMTQQELCVWARDEFKLVHLPHQSTISKILARASELTNMPTKYLSSRRKGLVTHPELDTALCNWVLFARQSNVKLSGDMIKDKARQLAATLGLESKMTFSNGWLGGFKKRHNIRLGSSATATSMPTSSSNTNTGTVTAGTGLAMPTAGLDSSAGSALLSTLGSPDATAATFSTDPAAAFVHMAQAASAVSATVPPAVRELQDVLKLYHPSDVFALSETGLYYALSPEKPTGRCGSSRLMPAGLPTRRERLIVALAVNADGSEQLEPFFIGTAKLSRKALASGLDGEELVALQYRDNPRAWVTPVVFQEWIGLLDSKLRDDGRSVLLLVASAPAHIRIGLELTNVRLEVLPPSTTQQFQPFELGIFDAFKRRYRRHALHHALDRFDAGLADDDVFAIDSVRAMRWARACWFTLPATLLRYYWDVATDVANGANNRPSASIQQQQQAVVDTEAAVEREICDAVAALHVARPLALDDFVRPSDESVGLHCPGTDETDFVCSVSEHAGRAFAAAKLANELSLIDTTGSADSIVGAGSRTTNEQLVESLRVLLPELDRLRFDEHTKASIRLAFRRLKDKDKDKDSDSKQRQLAVRRAMQQCADSCVCTTSDSTGADGSVETPHAAVAIMPAVATAEIVPVAFDVSMQMHGAATAGGGAAAVGTKQRQVAVRPARQKCAGSCVCSGSTDGGTVEIEAPVATVATAELEPTDLDVSVQMHGVGAVGATSSATDDLVVPDEPDVEEEHTVI